MASAGVDVGGRVVGIVDRVLSEHRRHQLHQAPCAPTRSRARHRSSTRPESPPVPAAGRPRDVAPRAGSRRVGAGRHARVATRGEGDGTSRVSGTGSSGATSSGTTLTIRRAGQVISPPACRTSVAQSPSRLWLGPTASCPSTGGRSRPAWRPGGPPQASPNATYRARRRITDLRTPARQTHGRREHRVPGVAAVGARHQRRHPGLVDLERELHHVGRAELGPRDTGLVQEFLARRHREVSTWAPLTLIAALCGSA